MPSIVAEKLDQAVAILNELRIDCWLTFVRETGDAGDPALPLVLGRNLTWQSALIVTREGDRVAIVGNYDADAVRTIEGWTDVVPYVQGIRDPLVETLDLIKPRSIAINYSPDDRSGHKPVMIPAGYPIVSHSFSCDTSKLPPKSAVHRTRDYRR